MQTSIRLITTILIIQTIFNVVTRSMIKEREMLPPHPINNMADEYPMDPYYINDDTYFEEKDGVATFYLDK